MSYHTVYPNGILKLLFAICFCIPSYVHQQLLSLDCQYFVHYKSLVLFYLSLELSWCRVSFLKGDLQFSKFLKNTICIGLCKLKCTEKRFIPFTPLHFLPEFVPRTEFKGRPEDAKWNVLNHTSFRNYAPFSLQVPSILSILLDWYLMILFCLLVISLYKPLLLPASELMWRSGTSFRSSCPYLNKISFYPENWVAV